MFFYKITIIYLNPSNIIKKYFFSDYKKGCESNRNLLVLINVLYLIMFYLQS